MRAALALAFVLPLGLAACSASDEPAAAPAPSASASPTPTQTQTPEPAPVVPAAGACYRITFDEALAPSSEDDAVDCAVRHTSQTYAVGDLDAVVGGHLLAVDSERVRSQVARTCPDRLADYLGATPAQLRLSLLRSVWFTPTLAESDIGASWFRCDVVAVTGDDTSSGVAKVSGSLEGVLGREAGRTTYGICGTAAPGEEGFSRVLCRDEHTWRAITVVDLAELGRKYPGEKPVREAGEDGTCSDAARELADDALDFEWGYEWPTLEQWRAGQTFGRCWAPTAG